MLGDAARVPERIIPISTVLHLTSEGLVLGAGTLLVAADAARRQSSLRGQEARVLALLSAAYNRAVPSSVLGNIERAAKSWREGDDSLAYIHLAHTGLPELQGPPEAARRLFLADGLMKAGGKPRTIWDYVKKFINPENPTRRGWGFQFPNPKENGALVYLDDCQHTTGMLAEIKGEYAGVLAFEPGRKSITEDWLDQSARQVAARGWRRLRWYFAEPATAAFAKKIFKDADQGRETIEIEDLPWPEQKQ